MTIFSSDDGSDDDTPFDGSGLKDKSIKTRAQLNEAEFDNIQRATEKYLLSVPPRKLAPFDYGWFLKLHHEMFGKVWSWAGEVRTVTLTLGINPAVVPERLGSLAMDIEFRHQEAGDAVIATAVEIHHRAVHIHPFKNGNGRWSRMLANIWLLQHGQPLVVWPDDNLRNTESSIRKEYIAAIKEGDLLNLEPLIELHKRYQQR